MSAEVKILTGAAGSGKSTRLDEELVDLAYACPEKKFYLIVPEQAGSSMEQRILRINRERTGRRGFFNIDIIGFTRLAHRVFEEQGRSMRMLLEDYGKTILLRSVVGRVRKELKLYQGSIDRPGFISELKSLFSEFFLFDILPEDLEKAISELGGDEEQLRRKLLDVQTIYRAFREDELFREDYMIAEELPQYLAELLHEPGEIRCIDGAVFLFDGFEGFTAEQRKVLEMLRKRASKMSFAVTLDPERAEEPLFGKSREMLEQLLSLAPDAEVKACPLPEAKTALQHLVREGFRFPVREYEKEPGREIRIWKAEDPVEELRLAAEDIRRRVMEEGLRYRDFAVLSADLDGVSSFADQVMREYELPYFLDHTRSFTHNPVIDAQLYLLEILDRDFSYESVFSFVKTGILNRSVPESDLEILENFVIEHGIRGRKLWKKDAISFCRIEGLDEEARFRREKQLERVDRARRAVLGALSPVLSFAGGGVYPVAEMIGGLLSISDNPELFPDEWEEEAEAQLTEMGYPADGRAYRGLGEKYRMILSKTAAILGDQKMSVHELRESLLIGVRELRVGVIPPTLDSVLIGDLERTRIGSVRVLYILNLNEGVIPAPKAGGGILSDQDRNVLSCHISGKMLAPDETEKRFREQFSVYLAMSRPTDSLILSYAEKNRKGKEMERSSLLGRIQRCFPKLGVTKKMRRDLSGAAVPDRASYISLLRKKDEGRISPEEEERLRVFRELFPEVPYEYRQEEQGNETLPQELMSRIGLKISVSKAERYAGCPYSFFLNYILGLSPRKIHEVKDPDIGTILHRALELIFTEVKEERGNDWKTLPEKELPDIVRKNVERAVLEERPEMMDEDRRSGKSELILGQVEFLAGRSLEVMKSQLERGEFLPEMFESRFEAEFTAMDPAGEAVPVKLSGIIDRVDVLRKDGEMLIRILDYKTGNKKMDLRDLRDGRNLQLALYLKLLTGILEKEEKNVVPAGMYYFHVDRPVITKLKKSAASEEEALKEETEKLLRFRGIPNVSPAEGEESEHPKYYIAELQDRTAVNEERKLVRATVLPIDQDRSGGISAGTMLATTEQMEGLGDYALYMTKVLSERILSGRIEKHPVKMAGARKTFCAWCSGTSVCRFRKEETPVNFVRTEKDNGALLDQLAKEGSGHRVSLRNAGMRKEVLPEDREEQEEVDPDDGEE